MLQTPLQNVYLAFKAHFFNDVSNMISNKKSGPWFHLFYFMNYRYM